MIERELILNAATSLLLLCLIWRHPFIARRLRPAIFGYAVAGALLPLLDLVIFNPLLAGRLDFLNRPPLFSAPVFGAAFIFSVAWLAGQLIPTRQSVTMALGWGMGYAVQLSINLLTPVGAPLLAPFSDLRFSFPFYPIGHPPLLVFLLLALMIQPWFSKRFKWSWYPVAGLTCLYFLAGPVQHTMMKWKAATLPLGKGGEFHVYPGDRWLTNWRVVVEDENTYQIFQRGIFQDRFQAGPKIPRWNNQSHLLTLLGDPVVRRLYYGVFRHPVAEITITGSRLKLSILELEDEKSRSKARGFFLERNLNGNNRSIHFKNFD